MCIRVYTISVVQRCWTFRLPPCRRMNPRGAPCALAALIGCLVMTLACPKPPALYRPRDPRASDLWRLLDEHFDCFRQVYDEQFQAKYGFWRPLLDRSVTAFLKCGDLQEGFARVRCPDCKHEMFIAFSCKQRCTCPSCHQKKIRLFGALPTETILMFEFSSALRECSYVRTIPDGRRSQTRPGHHRPDTPQSVPLTATFSTWNPFPWPRPCPGPSSPNDPFPATECGPDALRSVCQPASPMPGQAGAEPRPRPRPQIGVMSCVPGETPSRRLFAGPHTGLGTRSEWCGAWRFQTPGRGRTGPRLPGVGALIPSGRRHLGQRGSLLAAA